MNSEKQRTVSLIAVDAPPDKENANKFIAIGKALSEHGSPVPEVLFYDLDHGFMLLEDFGNRLLLAELTVDNVNQYYQLALDSLLHLQRCSVTSAYKLPNYDRQLLHNEMLLFPQWFLGEHLSIPENDELYRQLPELFKLLADSAAAQPQVCVHRDFHSRNIMLINDNELGIIDFQDAVLGPITYDLVSLLKDCYIVWPRQKVLGWVADFYHCLIANKYDVQGDLPQFIRWFDFMGMQRHIKVLGIFARLNHRDNKSGFLKDMPATLNYIIKCCTLYPELKYFGESLTNKIAPLILNSYSTSNSN